jgi:5-methylcytosine-specific restriction endonuclease McrA
MPKLTENQIQERVFKNSLETCDYIKGYVNGSSIITVKCRIHNYEFETKYENVKRENRAHYICPLCQKENIDKKYEKNRTEVECAYCHKKFLKQNSKLENSKTGLYFCCREHKDLAQRLESGSEFEKMRPEHYGTTMLDSCDYRKKAFYIYEHKCAVCGYDEEENILQVHHIDENRQNNDIENLIILCPNCHAKITWGKYILKDRKQLVKNDE